MVKIIQSTTADDKAALALGITATHDASRSSEVRSIARLVSKQARRRVNAMADAENLEQNRKKAALAVVLRHLGPSTDLQLLGRNVTKRANAATTDLTLRRNALYSHVLKMVKKVDMDKVRGGHRITVSAPASDWSYGNVNIKSFSFELNAHASHMRVLYADGAPAPYATAYGGMSPEIPFSKFTHLPQFDDHSMIVLIRDMATIALAIQKGFLKYHAYELDVSSVMKALDRQITYATYKNAIDKMDVFGVKPLTPEQKRKKAFERQMKLKLSSRLPSK